MRATVLTLLYSLEDIFLYNLSCNVFNSNYNVLCIILHDSSIVQVVAKGTVTCKYCSE